MKRKCQKTEFRGGHLGFLPMSGTNSSFKVKGVKIPKSLGVKNITKITSRSKIAT